MSIDSVDLRNSSAGDVTHSEAVLEGWQLPLEGQRVRLRRLRCDDLSPFHAYRSDPEVGRYQGWSLMSTDDALHFIETMLDVSRPRQDDWIQLGIATRASDTLIGDVGVYLAPDAGWARIGYTCAPASQGNGIGSEAVGLLITALTAYTPCRRVIAEIDSRNIASERLLLRLGFDAEDARPMSDSSGAWVEVTYARAL